MDNLLTTAGRLTGVHIETLAWETEFCDLAARFAHLPGTVALLSGGDLDCARYHLLGAFPWLTLCGQPNAAQLTIDGRTETIVSSPFEVLRTILDHYHLPEADCPVPMTAGLMGYLAQNDVSDDASIRRAMIFGTIMSSYVVEDFSLEPFKRIDDEALWARYHQFIRFITA